MPFSQKISSKEKLDEYILEIEKAITEFLADEITTWNEIDASIHAPLNALKLFFDGGGKRLRPAFCYLGYGAGSSGDITDDIINAGCTLELLHTFALIHDDIMDRADTRRGLPTVHKQLQELYKKNDYVGDIEHFSTSVAILTGDFAFTYADKFSRFLPPKCLDIYDVLKTELFAGQQMDLDAVYKKNISKDKISKIAQYKSGKYTIERPLQLGVLLANPNADIKKWSYVGAPLGEAFQLRDDVLGIFGEPDSTGKPVGDDLREGKFTLLVAEALERSDDSQIKLLNKRGNSDIKHQEIEDMITIIDKVGARDAVEQKIERLYEQSIAALETLELDADVTEYAIYLAKYVCWREQ